MKTDDQVPFDRLTRADDKIICDWLLGQSEDEILSGGMYKIRIILAMTPLGPLRWCELQPEQLAAVMLRRLNSARAAFFRIRCAFSDRETDGMEWRELGEAAKAVIEQDKASRPKRPTIRPASSVSSAQR